jgi:hypothetical protein
MLPKKKINKTQTKLNFNPLGRTPTKSVEKLLDGSLNISTAHPQNTSLFLFKE